MSKVVALKAQAQAGKVTLDSLPVDVAEILSAGKGQSSGVLLIFGDKAFYLTSNATDLEQVIGKLVEIVQKLSTTLTSIGAGMTGPTTAPPPTLPVDVAELVAMAAELTALKEMLK